ncbi:ankyrin repeat domain-containing protein [Aureibaculum conchae]|uniref:ankyrin repeat domain-containing protein n=1 Tax=Aureibaculum sp. 2308TA14-22 TaxID=3108392 RepID=UPI0033987D94
MNALLNFIREKDLSGFEHHLSKSDELVKNINSINKEYYSDWFPGIGFTLLQIVSFVNPLFANFLLEKGAKHDIFSAAALGKFELAKKIAKRNPSLLNIPIGGFYPIQFAMSSPTIFEFFLEIGESPERVLTRLGWFDWEDNAINNNLSEWKIIHMAALGRRYHDNLEIARILLKHGANLSASSLPFGESALHIAAIYNNPEFIDFMISNGVDVDIKTLGVKQTKNHKNLFNTSYFEPFISSSEKTPLMLASGEGQIKAAKVLLKLGADPNKKDSLGFTSLHYAAGNFWEERLDIVKLLINHDANPYVIDVEGRTPSDIAQLKNYKNVSKFLDKHSIT